MFVINLHDGISGLYKTYLIDENDYVNIIEDQRTK